MEETARIRFTPKEFGLLQLFLQRKGRLLTREFLINDVWGPEYVGYTKTLDAYIKRLRQKVEGDPRRPRHILTVRGLGYKYEVPKVGSVVSHRPPASISLISS